MDIRIHVGRRAVLLVAVGIVLFAAGGVAYAKIADSGGVLTACRLNSNGQLRLIDPSASSGPLSRCTANETQVSWNQAGQPGAVGPAGKDGVSPTVAQLQTGDSHCASGGASITDASGNTAYVCNGANGADGQPGKDGAPFNGTFTSPNGKFSLTVADGGVTIVGPDSSVALPAAGGIFIQGGDIHTNANNVETQIAHDETTHVGHDRNVMVGNDVATKIDHDDLTQIGRNRNDTVGANESLTVDGGRTESVQAGETIDVAGSRSDHVGGSLDLRAGATASLTGGFVAINGGACKPAARAGDAVNSTQIIGGSATVCIGG